MVQTHLKPYTSRSDCSLKPAQQNKQHVGRVTAVWDEATAKEAKV